MAGYTHGASSKYTPAEIERMKRIRAARAQALADQEAATLIEKANAERARELEEVAGELLDTKRRKLAAQNRLEKHRLAETLKREALLTTGTAAARELARIQEEHPQPEGIGAARMSRLLREIDAAKRSGWRAHKDQAVYDIAA